MPQTIVFDTNYIRSTSGNSFLNGEAPPKLANQFNKAMKRGDLVLIPATVITEINAWLKDESFKRHTALQNAARTLQESAYKITPELPTEAVEPDITSILKSANLSFDILIPTIEEYKESERRTSYRIPPHPKNQEHEEMRDRLIWCQLLNYSKSTLNHIIIVSGDQIFKNGAASPEGVDARILVASTSEELDQRLGEIPDHIKSIINNLLTFSDQINSNEILITADNIESIDQLRKSRTNNSIIEHKFDLILKGQEKPLHCKISTLGESTLQLMLNDMVFTNQDGINSSKQDIIFRILQERTEGGLSELRRIIGE